MINYGYFRHRFDAHNDSKLMALKSRKGLAGYASYFILLEIFGDSFNQDESKNDVQEIHIRRIANALELRSDSTRTVLELLSELELIDPLRFNSDSSSVQVGIPNFSKYYGSYKKKEEKKGLNKIKENKIKENKRKEKENKEKAATGNVEIDENCSTAKTHEVIEEFSCLVDQAKEYAEKIPEKQQRKLVYDYGEELASRYILKLAEWDSRQPQSRRKKDYYLTIVKWLGDAGIESKSSIEKRQDALNKKIAKMDAEARARNESHV